MKVERDNPEVNRCLSGIECGQVCREIVDSGLLGNTVEERKVFLEILGVDNVNNYRLEAAAPDLLFELTEALNCRWHLAQFYQNFKEFRDGLNRQELPCSAEIIDARQRLVEELLTKLIAIARTLPAERLAETRELTLKRVAEELSDKA